MEPCIISRKKKSFDESEEEIREGKEDGIICGTNEQEMERDELGQLWGHRELEFSQHQRVLLFLEEKRVTKCGAHRVSSRFQPYLNQSFKPDFTDNKITNSKEELEDKVKTTSKTGTHSVKIPPQTSQQPQGENGPEKLSSIWGDLKSCFSCRRQNDSA